MSTQTVAPPNTILGGPSAGSGAAQARYRKLVAADVPTIPSASVSGLGTAATQNKVAAGNAGVLDATDATTTNSRAPNGSASGDLSGSYPNPTVANLNGIAAAYYPYWQRVTKTYTQLSAASLTNDIEAFSLPSGYALMSAMFRSTTAFAGGAISGYTLSLGIATNLIKYIIATSVFGAPGNVNNGVQVSGVLPCVENFSGATSIRLSAVSTIGLLNAANAGSVDIYYLVAKLP